MIAVFDLSDIIFQERGIGSNVMGPSQRRVYPDRSPFRASPPSVAFPPPPTAALRPCLAPLRAAALPWPLHKKPSLCAPYTRLHLLHHHKLLLLLPRDQKSSTLAFTQRTELLLTEVMMPPLPLRLNAPISLSASEISSASAKDDDRFPQWSYQETLDLIHIRAELDKDFSQTKRNKMLWEVISIKMKDRGHPRSAEQCKCKWKNVINRYKIAVSSPGKETSEIDNGRHCPFFEELHAIFTERAKTIDRLLLESESGDRAKKKHRKGLLLDKASEDFLDNDDEEDEDSEDERMVKLKKRKADRERQRSTAEKCRANSMQEVLEDFFQQQNRFEIEWREAMERREEERRSREREFRNAMESLEKERIMREQHWLVKEEQRRAREEARAEKRDAIFSAILKRLVGEEL